MAQWLLIGLLALALQGQQGTDLLRAGRDALDRHDGQAAAAAFQALLDANPNDARALTGAGLAAHMLGRDDQAVTFLKRAIEIDSRRLDTLDALAGISYAQGELAAAIEWYERFVKLAPGDRAAAERLDAWKREAAVHDTLVTQPTGRFTVLFEGETQQALAARVSEVLEAAYYRIGKALNAYAPNPVTVILYTGEQFRDITRSPSWAAGAYDGRIRVPVGGAMKNPAEFDRVIVHEFVHAVIHQVYPRIPKWLNEGLATYLEPSSHAGLLTRLRGPDGAIPVDRLSEAFQTPDGNDAALAYAESYVGARLLAEKLPTGLPVLLQYLSEGMALDEALQLFNISIADLEHEWTRRDYDRDRPPTIP
jgi:tetratricopeptide (TPR) repeat protein